VFSNLFLLSFCISFSASVQYLKPVVSSFPNHSSRFNPREGRGRVTPPNSLRPALTPVAAKTPMGKPLFKTSEGGRINILREWEGINQSELQQGPGTQVLLSTKFALKPFRPVHPCPYSRVFCNIRVNSASGWNILAPSNPFESPGCAPGRGSRG
jgi:hypothetical protein